MKKIFNSAELKIFWDSFEKLYSTRINYNFQSVFVNMCNITDLHCDTGKNNILELSIGPGTGLAYLYSILNKRKVTIYGTDISTNMLNTSFNNLVNLNGINLNYGSNKVNNDKTDVLINLEECDNENLNIFENKKFDILLSNLSLHLVENPDLMLQESSRVLKDDGVACFSIWGRPENSLNFTIIPNTLKKFGIPLPYERSNFHISNIDKLKDLVLINGFTKFNYCYTTVGLNIKTPDEFLFMIESPNFRSIFSKIEEKLKEEIIADILLELDKIINVNNQMISTEIIIIRCAK